MTAPARSHDAATCPAFGGCNDCRSAKFEAASPDVVISADAEAEDDRPPLEPWEPITFNADPVDYAGVPAFNAAADATLARAGATSNQRAGEYLDTWALEGQNTPFLDSVLRDLGVPLLPRSALRLVMAAAMADIKLSRLGGAWKADTCLDLINYVAALTAWRSDYDNT